jgi:DNA-binding transcriptional regulator YdaS (Cro superfamily)
MKNEDLKSLIGEIQLVKNLLIIQALAVGCKQKHIAAALGVSDATLSRMFPKGVTKEIAKIAERRTESAET